MEHESSSQRHLERFLTLRTFPDLEDVSSSALSAMAEIARERWFSAGEVIYAEGEEVKNVYWVVSGLISIKREGAVVHQLADRSTLGRLSSLAHVGDSPEAMAEEETWAFEIDGSDLSDILEENFDLLLSNIRQLSGDYVKTRRAAGPSAGFRTDVCPLPTPAGELTVVDRISYLSQSLAFASSRIESITELTREAREVRLGPGDVIWEFGEKSSEVYNVVSGAIRGWNEKQEFVFGPGDFVGGLDALANEPRWFHAEVKAPLVAIVLNVEHLLDVFEDNTDMALTMLSFMAQGLIDLRKTFATVVYEKVSWT